VRRVILAPFHPQRLRVLLPNGPHVLRLSVVAESAPRGTAFSTGPVALRVH
jgi:hypothetical protein